MGTVLRAMTEAAYARFRDSSVASYAKENVAAGRWPAPGALERSQRAYEQLLPQGRSTPGQHLFTIHDATAGEDVGSLWLAVVDHPGGRSGFIYDVTVYPAHRRLGHARAAFAALDALAKGWGLSELGLHVFAHNQAAQALYRSLGYQVSGLNMQKRIG
jgi:ribosomal protein S18 acetylase RimI-like enzyme